jgi:hypothetical protein
MEQFEPGAISLDKWLLLTNTGNEGIVNQVVPKGSNSCKEVKIFKITKKLKP